MGIEFLENFEELELELQFLLNFSHEWELEWESPWFLDQLLISEFIYGNFQLGRCLGGREVHYLFVFDCLSILHSIYEIVDNLSLKTY